MVKLVTKFNYNYADITGYLTIMTDLKYYSVSSYYDDCTHNMIYLVGEEDASFLLLKHKFLYILE